MFIEFSVHARALHWSRRIICWGGLLYYALISPRSLPVEHLAELPEIFWEPLSTFAWLGLRYDSFSAEIWFGLKLLFFASLAAAGAGRFIRFSLWTAFALAFFLLGAIGNYGQVELRAHGFVFALLALASSYQIRSAEEKFVPAGFIPLIRAYLLIMYFVSGAQKLRLTGLQYVKTDFLAVTLQEHQTWLGQILAQWPLLCRGLGGGLILWELLALLPLLRPRWTKAYAVSAVAFHVLTFAALGIDFTPQVLALALLFPEMKITTAIPALWKRASITVFALIALSEFIWEPGLWPFAHMKMYAFRIDPQHYDLHRVQYTTRSGQSRILNDNELSWPLDHFRLHWRLAHLANCQPSCAPLSIALNETFRLIEANQIRRGETDRIRGISYDVERIDLTTRERAIVHTFERIAKAPGP